MNWLATEAQVRAAIERWRAEAWRQALRVDDGPQTILVAPGDAPRRQTLPACAGDCWQGRLRCPHPRACQSSRPWWVRVARWVMGAAKGKT